MAWTPADDFDSYSDGDLNGGSGGSNWSTNWSGSTQYDIQGTTVYEGAKAVLCTHSTGQEPEIDRTYSGITDGIVQFVMRRDSTTLHATTFNLRDGSGGACYVQMGGSGNAIVGGSTTTNIHSYSANTWYLYGLEFDCSTDQARANVDGGAFTSWINFNAAKTSLTIARLSIGASGAGTVNSYWDFIGPYVPPATGANRDGRNLILLGVG